MLANERTLLAYIRTTLGFLMLGLPLVVMFPGGLVSTLGVLTLGIGGGLLVVGVMRFMRMRARLLEAPDWKDQR
jgi:putative membrane protein